MMTARTFIFLALFGWMTFVGQSEALAQSKTQNIAITAPTSIRANTTVTFNATVSDSWTSTKLGSRMVAFSVGEQFYLTSAGSYPTNSSGIAAFSWKFTKPGKYRVVAYVADGSGYLSQRTTLIVTVN